MPVCSGSACGLLAGSQRGNSSTARDSSRGPVAGNRRGGFCSGRWELPLAVSGGCSSAPSACCQEGSLLLSAEGVLKAELGALTEVFPEIPKELHPPLT